MTAVGAQPQHMRRAGSAQRSRFCPERPQDRPARRSAGRRPYGRRLRVEDDRHGPVVDELHLHPRAEGARRDGDPERAQPGAEALVERLGLLRRRGGCEARSVPLRRVLLTSEVNRRMEPT